MRKELRTIGFLTVLKIAGAIAAVLYSVFQVRYFGTDRIIEVYFAAHAIIYLVQSLTQSGQLSEIFLPIYIGLRERIGNQAAHAAVSVVINRMALYVILFLCIMYILAPWVVAIFIPGFSLEDKDLGTEIFRKLLPLVLFMVTNSLFNSVLNAEKVFGRTEAAALINSLLSLLLLILFYTKLGIYVLVLALYAGAMVQLGLTIFFLIRKRIRYYWIWTTDEFNHSSFFKSMFSTFIYTSSTQFLNWAYTASISFLPQGTFAIFRYVQNLFSKVNGVFAQPISTVLFTRFSEELLHKLGNEVRLKERIRSIQEGALLFGLCLFSVTIAGGKEGLSFLWYGSKFGMEDISKAYILLIAFFFVMVFQIFYTVNRKYSVALGNARHNYNWQALGQFLSAITGYILISKLGFYGIIFALLINRFLLISVPFVINNYKAADVFSTPSKFFLFRFTITIVIFPFLILVVKQLNIFGLSLGTSKTSDLLASIIWIVSTGMVMLTFLRIAYYRTTEWVLGMLGINNNFQ